MLVLCVPGSQLKSPILCKMENRVVKMDVDKFYPSGQSEDLPVVMVDTTLRTSGMTGGPLGSRHSRLELLILGEKSKRWPLT